MEEKQGGGRRRTTPLNNFVDLDKSVCHKCKCKTLQHEVLLFSEADRESESLRKRTRET